jgi:hypothetical protein
MKKRITLWVTLIRLSIALQIVLSFLLLISRCTCLGLSTSCHSDDRQYLQPSTPYYWTTIHYSLHQWSHFSAFKIRFHKTNWNNSNQTKLFDAKIPLYFYCIPWFVIIFSLHNNLAICYSFICFKWINSLLDFYEILCKGNIEVINARNENQMKIKWTIS